MELLKSIIKVGLWCTIITFWIFSLSIIFFNGVPYSYGYLLIYMIVFVYIPITLILIIFSIRSSLITGLFWPYFKPEYRLLLVSLISLVIFMICSYFCPLGSF